MSGVLLRQRGLCIRDIIEAKGLCIRDIIEAKGPLYQGYY